MTLQTLALGSTYLTDPLILFVVHPSVFLRANNKRLDKASSSPSPFRALRDTLSEVSAGSIISSHMSCRIFRQESFLCPHRAVRNNLSVFVQLFVDKRRAIISRQPVFCACSASS